LQFHPRNSSKEQKYYSEWPRQRLQKAERWARREIQVIPEAQVVPGQLMELSLQEGEELEGRVHMERAEKLEEPQGPRGSWAIPGRMPFCHHHTHNRHLWRPLHLAPICRPYRSGSRGWFCTTDIHGHCFQSNRHHLRIADRILVRSSYTLSLTLRML